jgi:hypothetical protein
MALPPTIPTSFVPHSSANAPRRYRFDFIGAFSFLAYGIFLLTIALAVGVFLYAGVLAAQLKSKDIQLAKERDKINTTLAHSFIRLDNRLIAGQKLLDDHIALSNFFRTLGTALPNTVRFSALQLNATDAKKIIVSGSGVAKNFNALASASVSFASGGDIKDAIFSRIVVNKDNSVSFALVATVDPKLISFNVATLAVPPAEPSSEAASATTTQP